MSQTPQALGRAAQTQLLAAARDLHASSTRTTSSLERPALTRVLMGLEVLRGMIVAEGPPKGLPEIENTLAQACAVLHGELERALCFTEIKTAHRAARIDEILGELLAQLPTLRELALEEAQAAYRFDPSCTSLTEALYCLPGLMALGYHRFAHFFHTQGVPLIPRGIAEFVHSATGIDIHPGARIGRGCFIDHGTGVVIGETCVIGDRVRIYQGVTLGAGRFAVNEDGSLTKGGARHPVIGDEVVLYAGATVLGRIHVGDHSVIAACARVTEDIKPHHRVANLNEQLNRELK